MSVEEVLDRVRELGGKLVEITGGEPLLQEEVYPLAERLLREGCRVLVETSGERFVGELPKDVVKIVDVKCPGSGESGKFCFDNLGALAHKDQVKFVILEEADYLYAREFLARHELRQRVGEVIFSPVFGQMSPRTLAEWILRDNLDVRVGLQLHKFIWEPDARGV
jgi:7-carboxy-7-deazaguanine synthase